MTGFLDRCYCATVDCANTDCNRNVTKEVMDAARKWWGADNPPICMGGLRDSAICVTNGGYKSFDSSGANTDHNE